MPTTPPSTPASPGVQPTLELRRASISDERLRQLSGLKQGAENRIRRLERQKEKLEAMEELVAGVPATDQRVLSRTARQSTISRGEKRGTESVTKSVERNRKLIQKIEEGIEESEQ
ncbi:hypothetical protein MAPG_10829 [Magnaporthiopsis poae ATCC 64411]|uniref:Uncharacterized protein n=1 Tax=Magnaporthiopsis poae (strain ATCC 64411 / 73-15) TaxID=644358 RepID=A0A0C4EDM4_MAGP6|nr:hypothetical protein MAPG_10829 [Magnaporthiopsis poae ATCC 64411]